MSTISAPQTQVVIGGQVFYVPSDRLQEVYALLTRLQSIAVNETQSLPHDKSLSYRGQSLING